MFIMVSDVVLPHMELLVFAFLFEILDIILYVVLVPHVKLAPPLDVDQPQIPFAKILILMFPRAK
jgi:hypothetical protein